MSKLLMLILSAMLVVTCSHPQKTPANFVFVKDGAFKNTHSVNYFRKSVIINDFYIGKYEVTQKEWMDVMGNIPSQFKGDNLPVETVSWYNCVEYCNKRSTKEGLQSYYNIDSVHKDQNNKNEIDDIRWHVTINEKANGYRLPVESEWEYAAGGGQESRSFRYSGSDDPDSVAWYWKNSGDKYLGGNWSWPALVQNNNKTKPVGGRKPNELGIYDMSGNVREWCWDWNEPNGTEEPQGRTWKGGGWIGAEFCCEPPFRAGHEANGKGPDQGFRVCRSNTF